jgi:hypothetical protein
MTEQLNILDLSINNKFIDNDEYVFTDKDNSKDNNKDNKENKKDLIDFNIIHTQNTQNIQNIQNTENTQKIQQKMDKEPIKVKKQINEKDNTILTIDNEIYSNDTNASRDIDDSDKSTDILNNPTMLALKKIGSRTFRTQIMTQYIRPRIEKDINNCFIWRDKWSKISNAFFSMSEIICIVQTIMAFTASSYDMKLLSFLAGMLGVLCISFNRFGTYARNASSEKTSQLNEVLGTIGIKDVVPDLMDNDYGDGDKKKK